ncbi:FAD-dependent oxidoreductase [Candidatus Pacearchaeota archaeon]|nr:FAD-dependent oxidoreductase [Candidatus Pacearchaeota archaeon]
MNKYDFLIIGAGGTGLAAAMYAARLGMKTLVLGFSHGTENPVGGVITTTNIVENYPGFIKLTGYELSKKIEEHTRSYDLVEIKQEKAVEIKKSKYGFIVKTSSKAGGTYETKTLLFATGTKWRKLPESVKGSREFENKGVNYCALCDGPLYKNKIVAVVGGSDSAAKDALLLAEHSVKVYIIYRGEKIHPEPINLERVNKNKKIEIINKTNIVEVKGDERVRGVLLDKAYKNSTELKLDGVFVAIGHIIISELAENIGVKLNKEKEIIINHMTSETNMKGIYAAGDVTDKPFKQLITGVADGCTAAYSAYEYINKEKIEP